MGGLGSTVEAGEMVDGEGMVEVVERVGVDEDDEKREALREESGGGAVLNNLSGFGIE